MAEVVDTANYILNRFLIRSILRNTPHGLFKDRKPNVSHFHAFGSKCFFNNNDKKNLGKLDERSNKGIFAGYLFVSKEYSVYDKYIKVIEESIHVVFDETNNDRTNTSLFDEFRPSKCANDKDEVA